MASGSQARRLAIAIWVRIPAALPVAARPPPGHWPGQAEFLLDSQLLPRGTCHVRGDDVSGVPVERDAGAVVAHGGSRVGV